MSQSRYTNCIHNDPATIHYIIHMRFRREDPRDAVLMAPNFSGCTLATLPSGSVVGRLNIFYKKSDQINKPLIVY